MNIRSLCVASVLLFLCGLLAAKPPIGDAAYIKFDGPAAPDNTQPTNPAKGKIAGTGIWEVGNQPLQGAVVYFKAREQSDPNNLWVAGKTTNNTTVNPYSWQGTVENLTVGNTYYVKASVIFTNGNEVETDVRTIKIDNNK